MDIKFKAFQGMEFYGEMAKAAGWGRWEGANNKFTDVMVVSEYPPKQGKCQQKLFNGNQTSHRKHLQPCTHICVRKS